MVVVDGIIVAIAVEMQHCCVSTAMMILYAPVTMIAPVVSDCGSGIVGIDLSLSTKI